VEDAVPFRLRRDLEVHPAEDGANVWTVKDPVRLTYFRLEAEEMCFLQLLDGATSLRDLHQQLTAEYPDVEFDESNLRQFLTNGMHSDLLVATVPGYGREVVHRKKRKQQSRILSRCFNLISYRFRGIDPTFLLTVLDRWLGWTFHRSARILGGFLVILSFLLFLTRWETLVAELSVLQQQLTPSSLLFCAIAVVGIKIIHELSHALTCYRHGGECHEIGILLIGVMPILYCDVSDSWMERNPAKRIQVSAAGIIVEILIASVFALLWMASVPGPAHALFLNIVLLCSLNTVLFNGNPLLRYDGYYVFSDMLGIPNLMSEARTCVGRVFDRWILGQSSPDMAESIPRRLLLPVYGIAAMTYRWFVLFGILFFIYSLLKPWRLEGLVVILAASAGAGMLMSLRGFVVRRWLSVSQSGSQSGSGRTRAMTGLLLLGAAVAAVLFLPLPYSVTAPFTLSPGVSSPTYVQSAGAVASHVNYGETVTSTDTIAQLHNPDILASIEVQTAELRLAEVRLRNLQSTRDVNEAAAAAIPAAEKAVASAQIKLQQLLADSGRLELRSDKAGTVYPPRNRLRDDAAVVRGRSWDGLPLSEENHSAWLEENTLVCWIGSPADFRAIAFVDHSVSEFVRGDASVTIEFDSMPGVSATGHVTEVASSDSPEIPPEIQLKGFVAMGGSESRPVEPVFAVQIRVDDFAGPVPPLYSTGHVVIQCRHQSLADRLWRMCAETFAFEL